MVKELLSFWQPGMNVVVDRLVLENWNIGVQADVIRMLKDMVSPDRAMANAENQKMETGLAVFPNASDDHNEHIQQHMQEVSKLKQMGDDRTLKRVLDHIQEHQLIMAQSGGMPTGPVVQK